MKIDRVYENVVKSKYPFAIKILEERLFLENKLLKQWEDRVRFISQGQLTEEELPQLTANINSCNHRIIELKESIEELKKIN
jgi:hypothetical protein